MANCPHCQQAGVGFAMKWLSSPAMPARCRRCGGLSYVAASRSTDILLAATLWLGASGLLAALLNAAWPLIAGSLAAILFYCRHWQQASLIATDRETTERTQNRHTILSTIALVLTSLWH